MVGNEKIKTQVNIAIKSARRRNMSPPHMLLTGHPGCGKTSMAKLIAGKLGTNLISITPETLKNDSAILNLVDSLDFSGYDSLGNRTGVIRPTVVFIDECHRLPMFGQEKLGIIMENFTLNTSKVDKVYWVPYFTLIGATTLSGNLSKPFLDRFKLVFFFETYDMKDSIDIVAYHARKIGVDITRKAMYDIASRSRGIPRIIVGYLERCRDMMFSLNSVLINSEISAKTFEHLEIDEQGFNKIELKVLRTLYDNDKPVSLINLAMITGESPKTLQNKIETYLIKDGYLIRSGKGRVITAKGKQYLESKGYVGGLFARKTIPANYVRT